MNPDPLSLDWRPNPGAGLLRVAGEPFWFGGSVAQPCPLALDWAPWLLHLGRSWAALCLEAPWPLPWLAEALWRGEDFWAVADDRWEERPESEADAEEVRLLAFARSHNMATGWSGVALPALYWYRRGQEVRLCPEGRAPLSVPFAAAIAALERIGETLAAHLADSSTPLAHEARRVWQNRACLDLEPQIEISTGLSATAVADLSAGRPLAEFWECASGGQPTNDAAWSTNVLLAAARLTAGRLASAEIADVLERLRTLPDYRKCDDLDRLSRALAETLETEADAEATPYDQGYRLAMAFRQALGLVLEALFDPETWLRGQGVLVQRATLPVALEAVAVWGQRGPAIVVNDRPDIRPAHIYGYRFVLCHELAHLLIDRFKRLPACEVLGGAIDPDLEQRANAFAAETLLPRAAAASVYRQAAGLKAAVAVLSERFGVSRIVAKTQILNSGAADPEDRARIERTLSANRDLFERSGYDGSRPSSAADQG